uniref:Uncharacterized protein n=1 Tax=viral metagenome TaxID=1070528 RepID=A0A6C0KBU9_9ZZZZ
MTESIEYLLHADTDNVQMDYDNTHVIIKTHVKLFVVLLTLQFLCILSNMKFAALNIIICLYLVSYQIWTCITILNEQFELRAIVDSTDDDDQEVDEDEEAEETQESQRETQEDEEGEEGEEDEEDEEDTQEEHPTDEHLINEQPNGNNADDESEVVDSIPAPADVPIPESEDETEPNAVEPDAVETPVIQIRRRGRRSTKKD